MVKATHELPAVQKAYQLLLDSLDKGYGPMATTTHHRALVVQWFRIAVNDPTFAQEPVIRFDPEISFSRIRNRGVDLAVRAYVKFLKDPETGLEYIRDPMVRHNRNVVRYHYVLPEDRANEYMEKIVEIVDRILSHTTDLPNYNNPGDYQGSNQGGDSDTPPGNGNGNGDGGSGDDGLDEVYDDIWGIPPDEYDPTWDEWTEKEDKNPEPFGVPKNVEPPEIIPWEAAKPFHVFAVRHGIWNPRGYSDLARANWYLDGRKIRGAPNPWLYTRPDVSGRITMDLSLPNEFGYSKPAKAWNYIDIQKLGPEDYPEDLFDPDFFDPDSGRYTGPGGPWSLNEHDWRRWPKPKDSVTDPGPGGEPGDPNWDENGNWIGGPNDDPWDELFDPNGPWNRAPMLWLHEGNNWESGVTFEFRTIENDRIKGDITGLNNGAYMNNWLGNPDTFIIHFLLHKVDNPLPEVISNEGTNEEFSYYYDFGNNTPGNVIEGVTLWIEAINEFGSSIPEESPGGFLQIPPG